VSLLIEYFNIYWVEQSNELVKAYPHSYTLIRITILSWIKFSTDSVNEKERKELMQNGMLFFLELV
jgi:hypothetical protein